MLRRRMVLVLAMAGVIGGCWMVRALAQEDRPRDETRQRVDRRERMEQFRRRMGEMMRERLGATEEEWKALQPKIEKVQQLQRQTRGGFRGFGRWMGRRGRRPAEGQRPEGAPEREQTEVQKKTEALRNLLDDEATGAAAIKAALKALRQARQQAQKDLAAAQKELQDVVTMRQEAQLVLMGTLN